MQQSKGLRLSTRSALILVLQGDGTSLLDRAHASSQFLSSGPERTGVLRRWQAAVWVTPHATLQPATCLTRGFIRWVIPSELSLEGEF